GVQVAGSVDAHAGNVPGRLVDIGVLLSRHDKGRTVDLQVLEQGDHFAGLGSLQLERIDDDEFTVLDLGAQGLAQRSPAGLLGHRPPELPRVRTEDHAALPPQGRPYRTVTGPAGALLTPRLP